MKKSLQVFLLLGLVSACPGLATGQVLASAIAHLQAGTKGNGTVPETRKLKDVLQEYKNHYHVDIIFFNSTVDEFSVLSKNVTFDPNFEKSLRSLLQPVGLSYKKGKNGGYIITKKGKGKVAEPLLPSPEKNSSAAPVNVPVETKEEPAPAPKPTPKAAVVVDKTIKGKVTDEKGESMPGVSILIKGTGGGTTTDTEGLFSINVPGEQSVLVFSFMGYLNQEVLVANRTSFDIKLQVDNKQLDELVVVGYGSQKKGNITGAVSTIKVDDAIVSRALPNASSMMQGLIPGLAVNQNSGMAGNNSSQLIIRGLGTVNNASPLVVVDGMPDVDINRININDIESVTVLKDAASSSVYGSRAANGVILITTKSGKGSKETKINASVTYALEKPVKSYEFMADYARALTVHQRAAAVNTLPNNFLFKNGTIDQWMALGMIDPVKYPNTDWWDIILRDGQMKNYNVSASGGSDKSNFFISLGAMDEKGLQIENDFKRYNARFNYDAKIRSKINVGVRFAGNWSKYKYNYTEGFTANGSSGLDIFTAPSGILPYDPITGYYGGVMAYNENTQSTNPYVDIMNRNKNNQERKEVNGTTFIDWNAFKGFNARAEYSLNYYDQFWWRADIPTRAYNFQTSAWGPRIYVGDNERIYNYSNNGFKTQFSGRLSYEKTFGKNHVLQGMAAYSEEYWLDRNLSASRETRIHPTLHEIDAALNEVQATAGSSSREGLQSYIGRVNYIAFDKYLIEANFRYDGSSRFLTSNQFGFFPSVALGWRFSEEKFAQDLFEKIGISNGKLRATYGSLGNNSGVGRYEQQETLTAANYMVNGTIVEGFVNRKFINQNLSWEKTNVLNAGIDLGFLKNKLFVELDYYNRLTTGMNRPSDLSILLTGAYNAPRTNIGDMRNRGVEANVTWNERRGDFNYMVNFNFSKNKTVLEKWNEYLERGSVFINMPYNFVYAYESLGIAQTWEQIYKAAPQGASPGDILLKDVNGDGRIDANDMVAFPSFQLDRPTTNYAIRSSAAWKGFDIAVLVQAANGRKDFWLNQANNTKIPTANYASTWAHWDNTWSLDNRYAELPRLTGSLDGTNNTARSTYWLDNVSYIRLKNIQLGYSLTQPFMKKLGVNKIRVYGSADNIATITNFRGLDPEKSTYSNDAYPITKMFVFGLNIEL